MEVSASTVMCAGCRTEYPPDALFCPMCGKAKARDYDGDPMVGRVVGERYLVQSRLGHGASGSIYCAEHVTLHRKVALKVLHHELSKDELAIERFRRAATTVSEIDNDHIVSIHDFGRTEDGRLYIAMELMDGRTLDDVLAEVGQMAIPRAVSILVQLGEALMEAHAVGYIHRDLRPRNIFLAHRRGQTDYVKILDFGLAKLVEKEGQAASTSLGMTFGDPRYMSPEQARGDLVDRRTDIYSLGCIAYQMVVGDAPFVAPKVFDVLTKHLEAPPTPPIDRRPDCPDWVNAAILTSLAKRADERYVTIYRFIEALRQGSETGSIMATERVRRVETLPPPSVVEAVERLGSAPVDALAGDPEDTVQGVAPVRSDKTKQPSADRDDDEFDGRATTRADRSVLADGKPRTVTSSGISAAWYADGDALHQDAEAAEAGDTGALRRLEKRANAPSRTGVISYDDEYEDGSRRRLIIIAAGFLGVLALLLGLLWAAGGKPDKAAKAVEPPAVVAGADAASAIVATTEPATIASVDAAPTAVATPAVVAVAADAGARPAPPVPKAERPARARPKPEPTVTRREPAPRRDPVPKADPPPPAKPPVEPAPKKTGDQAQAEFYAKVGQQALRNGDILGAAASFKKARELDSSNASAIMGLGEIALSQGHDQDAIAHLKRAARLAPRSSRAHMLLGEAYLVAGQSPAAANSFKRALKLDPDSQRARNGYNEAVGND